MNDPLKNWEDLQNQWQSYEPDIKKIKKRISWVTWRMYAILALDIVVLISYFPFVYFVVQDESSSFLTNIWHYIMGVFVVYGVYLDFKLRLPVLKNNANTTKEVLSLFIERVKVGVSIGWWGKIFSFGLLVVFWIWVAVNYWFEVGNPKIANLGFLLIGSLWIIAIGLVFRFYENKKQKQLMSLSKKWKDYL